MLPSISVHGGGPNGEAGPGPSSLHAQTIAALQLRLREYDTPRAGRRLADAAVRGAAAGLALRGGLHLVSYVAGLLARSRRRAAAAGGSARPPAAELLRDALRWAAFLGSFSGVFVAGDEAIAFFGGRRRTRAWRALVAGALAGPTLLLTGRDADHTSLALYVLLRGLALLVRCGNLPTAAPWKRRLLAPTRWEHGDVALMCLSTSQLAYSWIVLPSTLPASYVRFLNKHGGKDLVMYQALREMCARAAAGAGPDALCALRGTPHERFAAAVPCALLHPGVGCTAHAARFLPAAYLRALPVYIPVYLIPGALVHRRRLLQRATAPALWAKIAVGALRSSAFLALFCALAWRSACAAFNLTGRTSGAVIAGACWAAGLATLVEKKSRRMELALYCASRSLEAFALTLAARGVLPRGLLPRRLDVLLFSAAAAAICHCYSDHLGERRDVFKSKYLAVFDFILGNTGFEKAGISHSPSNAALLALAARRAEHNVLYLVQSVTNLAGLAAAESDAGSESEAEEAGWGGTGTREDSERGNGTGTGEDSERGNGTGTGEDSERGRDDRALDACTTGG